MLPTFLFIAMAAARARAGDLASAEALVQDVSGRGVATGLGASLDAGVPWAIVDARRLPDGSMSGRASAGVDLYGGSDRFDLNAGLWLGAGEAWGIRSSRATGWELAVGARIGLFSGRLRHLQPWRLDTAAREDELRVGVALLASVTVFAQGVRLSTDGDVVARVGGGLSVGF